MVALAQVEIHHVSVSRQYIPCLSILKKVDAANIIIFIENVVVLSFKEGLQQRADPSDEGQRLSLEEVKLYKCLLKNEERHLNLQIIR